MDSPDVFSVGTPNVVTLSCRFLSPVWKIAMVSGCSPLAYTLQSPDGESRKGPRDRCSDNFTPGEGKNMKMTLKWMLIALTGFSVMAADAEAGCRRPCPRPCGPRPMPCRGGRPTPPPQMPPCHAGGGFQANVVINSHGGGGFYGGGYYGGRAIVGAGGVAYRRGNRLHRRGRRAAWFGFYGRANRLHARGNAAYARGNYRNARYYGWY